MDPELFIRTHLGVAPPQDYDLLGWLTLTGQSVLEITGGELFVDTDGRISDARKRLRWYPDDLWRYVIATDWARIEQEMPFIGRTASLGDDLSARVIASHLVRTSMHLGFLLERTWPPYSKWLGTAFSSLKSASALADPLSRALRAEAWPDREAALAETLVRLLDQQRSIGLGGPAHATEQFFARQFRWLAPIATTKSVSALWPPSREAAFTPPEQRGCSRPDR